MFLVLEGRVWHTTSHRLIRVECLEQQDLIWLLPVFEKPSVTRAGLYSPSFGAAIRFENASRKEVLVWNRACISDSEGITKDCLDRTPHLRLEVSDKP